MNGTITVELTSSIPGVTGPGMSVAAGDSGTFPLPEPKGSLVFVCAGLDAKITVTWSALPGKASDVRVRFTQTPGRPRIAVDWFVPTGSPVAIYVKVRLEGEEREPR